MEKTEDKKPYVEPRLRVIELETREVMANACKMIAAEMNIGLPECGYLNSCSDLGS